MKQKKFIVTYSSNPRTRWLEPEERVRELLEILARSLGQSATAGAEPAVTVRTSRTVQDAGQSQP